MNAKRILVVDDEPSVCDFLEDVLEPEGYEVLRAGDGYEALKLSMETKLDLVIMDLRMPSMNGVDAIRAIKMSQPNLPIVILTGLGKDELVVEGLREGAADVLTKPVAAGKVVECVRRALGMATRES